MEFDFSQLSEQLRRAIKELGFGKPTPIQKEAIPLEDSRALWRIKKLKERYQSI